MSINEILSELEGFEIIRDDEANKRYVWFKDTEILLNSVDKKWLLEEFGKEFPDDLDKEVLLQYIAGFIIREGIVISEDNIKPSFLKIIEK